MHHAVDMSVEHFAFGLVVNQTVSCVCRVSAPAMYLSIRPPAPGAAWPRHGPRAARPGVQPYSNSADRGVVSAPAARAAGGDNASHVRMQPPAPRPRLGHQPALPLAQ